MSEQLITLSLIGDNGTLTYRKVSDMSSDKLLLQHPLAPEVLVVVAGSELTDVQSAGRSDEQKLLEYVKKYTKYLDYDTSADVKALCLHFVTYRGLTARQKTLRSQIGGKIAAISLNNNLQAAIRIVNENQALLDDFNKMWYANFSGFYKGTKPIQTKNQRAAIFNMAGFVLAQLEENRIEFATTA